MNAPNTKPQPELLVRIFYEFEFKPARLANVAPQTLQQYESSVRRLSAFLGRPAILGDLTDNTLTAWMSTCGDYGLSPRTMKWRRTALNAICRLAMERGILPPDFPFLRSKAVGRPVIETRRVDESIGPGMSLVDFVDVYVERRNSERPIGRELSPDSRRTLLESAKSFGSWLGRDARVSDLSPAAINRYLENLHGRHFSPYTVKGRRTNLMCLLRRAIRMRLTQADPGEVRSVHCPKLVKEGYTFEDAQKLVAYLASLEGKVRHTAIPKATFWLSAVLTQWNLGIRIGDISRIEVSAFILCGTLFVVESKTGKSSTRVLHNSTRDAISQCIAFDPKRQYIWPGHSPRRLMKTFATLPHRCGLPGTSRFLRRGSSSAVERDNPGAGWRFLNHSGPSVFENFYRVDGIATPEALSPPEIALPEQVPAAPKPRRKRGAA